MDYSELPDRQPWPTLLWSFLRCGAPRPLIIGIVLYGASFLAASASSINMLILMRFVQGLGVAAPGVLARAIASDSFDVGRLPQVTNCITLAWGWGQLSPH